LKRHAARPKDEVRSLAVGEDSDSLQAAGHRFDPGHVHHFRTDIVWQRFISVGSARLDRLRQFSLQVRIPS
jgi:hypothetical protein